MNILDALEAKQMKDRAPRFEVGDTVRITVKVREGDKERTQLFQGVVIQKANTRNRTTFTVRKLTAGVGVERIFPLHSPHIADVKVVRRGRVRRARLYYLRARRGKSARIREQQKAASE
jgi:large subunit ribosomal protein L19